MTHSSLIDSARRTLLAESGDDVVRGERPRAFDLLDPALLKSGLAAIVLVALVDLDAFRVRALFDPLDLLLRLFALAAVARFAIALVRFARRLAYLRDANEHALVRVGDDVVLFGDGEPRAFRREDIVLVRVDEEPGTRRKRVVVLLSPPSAPALLALPETLAAAPEALAKRLERWADEGRLPEDALETAPTAPGLHSVDPRTASAIYDESLSSIRPGTAVFPAGLRWLSHGPYAALLFVVVFAERLMHLPRGTSLGPLPLAALVVCIVAPLVWWRSARRDARARGTAAFVATPTELMRRSHAGIDRAPWSDVFEVSLDTRWSWTALEGVHKRRMLVLERLENVPLRIDETTMGLSCETARAVAEAYRAGAFEVSSATPSSSSPTRHA